MENIYKLNNSSFKTLFADISSLCADGVYNDFLSKLRFLREDKPESQYIVEVGYSSAILPSNNTQYPVYILKFTKDNTKPCLVLFIGDDNIIFKVIHIESITQNKLQLQ